MKPYREGCAATTLVVRQPAHPWLVGIYGGAAVMLLGAALVVVVATLATSPGQLFRDPTPAGLLVLALAFAVPIAVRAPRTELMLHGGRLAVTRVRWPFRNRRELAADDVKDVSLDQSGTWTRLVLVLATGERVPLLASRWTKRLESNVAPLRQFVGLSVPEA